jgi:nucleotide-binding universal stress UspA family protein
MIQLKKILVPVDFSETSDRAIHYGLSLALQFRARLVVAHIVRSFAGLDYTFPTETFDLEAKALRQAKERLPEQVPWEFHDAVDLQTIVKTGDVRDELLGIIREEGIDLVVLGTHGRRRVERFLLGSTTEAMLRKVPVPVLTVSRLDATKEIHRAEPIPIRRIVYATDLSSNAAIGLHYSTELARTFGSDLDLVHVMDPIEVGYWGIEMGHLAYPQDPEAARLNALQQLQHAIEAEQAADMRIQAFAVEGVPHQAIIKFAEDVNADLLVLNMQNKGVLERAMLGATAERVIRSARVPVLSIPVATAADFMRVTPAA